MGLGKATLITGVLAGSALLGGIAGFRSVTSDDRPAVAMSPAPQELDGIVVRERLELLPTGPDIGGYTLFEDRYTLVVMDSCVPRTVQFSAIAVGDTSRYEDYDFRVRPGDRVRVSVLPDGDLFKGVALIAYGDPSGAAQCDGVEAAFQAALREAERSMPLDQLLSLGWYAEQDAYLLRTLSSAELWEEYRDADALRESVRERLQAASPSTCPTGMENLELLNHAELIRASLLLDYIDNPENQRSIMEELAADRADTRTEYGGAFALQDGGLMRLRMASTCRGGCKDYEYSFPTVALRPNVALHYHNHTMPGFLEPDAAFRHDACPSPEISPGVGDLSVAQGAGSDGVVFSEEDAALGTVLYTDSGVLLDLGIRLLP